MRLTRARIRAVKRRDERGMTIIELVVAMAIGTIVLMTAFTFLDHAFASNREISDRADASQRGRIAMERIIRQLRSQVCLNTVPNVTPAIRAGDDNSISLVVDLGDGSTNPELHTITYDPAAKTITEYDYAGIGTVPNLTFAAAPTNTQQLLTNVVPEAGAPIFSYSAIDSSANAAPGATTPLSTPLGANDLANAAKVDVAFVARPTGASDNSRATTLEDSVFARSDDPNTPTAGPTCA